MASSKIPVNGGAPLGRGAFDALSGAGLPASRVAPGPASSPPASSVKPGKAGKIHLRMERSGRSGKTVTVLFGPGVEALSEGERESLLKSLKGALGCGGAVAGKTLELQGEVTERVSDWLRARQ